MEEKKLSLELGGQTLTATFSRMAEQANSALRVQCGDTVVLVTATMSKKPREGAHFFPLMVDYEERFYAAGRIIGSKFIKREGRPSENAVLSGRMIDRCLRPLFDKHVRNEVQVVITVLSMDEKNDPDILGMIGASTALAVSDIPWGGPIGAVRLGRINGNFVVNPSFDERSRSDMDMVITGTPGKINMIEAKGNEISEEIFFAALQAAQKPIDDLVAFQEKIAEAMGKEKAHVSLAEKKFDVKDLLAKITHREIEDTLFEVNKLARQKKTKQLEEKLADMVKEKFEEHRRKEAVQEALIELDEIISDIVHENILAEERRPDGRKLDEVRELSSAVAVLPRTHGSAWFIRGTTQALSVVTLGSPGDEQTLDTMEEQGTKKRYMHHYNFPPYSVGEVSPMRSTSRREIGHGALAEKALESLLPSKEDFPYTIRVVSEILSSNGSSSMASVCGSTLALMDAGVPIKKPVAGIAMGIITGKKGAYKILTDIQGPEDHHGDMDFKAAGTREGLTAIQMDVKIEGVAPEMLNEIALAAKKARLHILDTMEKTIAEPRPDLSPYAPRIITITIPVDKIRDVIGPGGKVINEIIDKTGVSIDIEQTGAIFITSINQENAQRAVQWIKDLTREAKIGEMYDGKVVRIAEFGAFVEIFPGQDGLLHISEIANRRIDKVEDALKLGQAVKVKAIRIDAQNGKVALTMRNVPQ